MAKCEGCEKDFIVCAHNACGDDKGGFIVTHRDCDEWGCGLCMTRCDESPDEEYCMECLTNSSHSGMADHYTRRMENGWSE